MIGMLNSLAAWRRERAAYQERIRAEKLPPWRIRQDRLGIWVTDGNVAFGCNDHVCALRRIAELSRIWPEGTRKPTAREVKVAGLDGFALGWLGGLCFAIVCQALAWAIWR